MTSKSCSKCRHLFRLARIPYPKHAFDAILSGMPVTFRIEHFEGPLDLLLQLVEQEELNISHVSLARVAEQFVEYVNATESIPPEELADFLVVAAKLMYLKSKLLLPSFQDTELDEGPDLETQLREYQRFVAASKEIDQMWKRGLRSFTRVDSGLKPLQTETGFFPPPGVTAEVLRGIMVRVIGRIQPLIRLPQVNLERAVTIHDKIRDLFKRVKAHAEVSFHQFVSGATSRTEAIVSFLALLELVKQRFVCVEQEDLFQDIAIRHDASAPASDPFVESFL